MSGLNKQNSDELIAALKEDAEFYINVSTEEVREALLTGLSNALVTGYTGEIYAMGVDNKNILLRGFYPKGHPKRR